MSKKNTDGNITHFVCVCTGEMYGMAETYIKRLNGMLRAHHAQKFKLLCITDKPRLLPDDIQQIDASGWTELRRAGMRPTTIKLGIFNPTYLPHDDLIYLDLTLIIRSDMTPMINFMNECSEPLVIVRDWHYDSYNSSVMRVKNKDLRFIYDAFIHGETYAQKTPGDQDFIHAVIRARHQTQSVALLPDWQVCSLKQAVRTARRHPKEGKDMIERSIIVKFHGNPKMHNFFDAKFQFLKYGIGNLIHLKWGLPFDVKALQNAWTHDG